MQSSPLPTSSRFRIRVEIYPQHATIDSNILPKGSILLARGPTLPLFDITLRELCQEFLKRYRAINPQDSLFEIQRSQDENGSDLYLEDRVGDVFQDNEILRVVQGASIRASPPPGATITPSTLQREYATSVIARTECFGSDSNTACKRREFDGFGDSQELTNKRRRLIEQDHESPMPSIEYTMSNTSNLVVGGFIGNSTTPPTKPSEQTNPAVKPVSAHAAVPSPELGAENSQYAHQHISIGSPDLPRRRISSSSVNSTRRDSVFSNEHGPTASRLRIVSSEKKGLYLDRDRSISTTATTPAAEEHVHPPVRSPAATHTPKPLQRLKRSSKAESPRRHGRIASDVYDDIEETDLDETGLSTYSRRQSTLSEPSVTVGVSTAKWRLNSKTPSPSGRICEGKQPSSVMTATRRVRTAEHSSPHPECLYRTEKIDDGKAGQTSCSTSEAIRLPNGAATDIIPPILPQNLLFTGDLGGSDDTLRQNATPRMTTTARKVQEATFQKRAARALKAKDEREIKSVAEEDEARQRASAAATAQTEATARAIKVEIEATKEREEAEFRTMLKSKLMMTAAHTIPICSDLQTGVGVPIVLTMEREPGNNAATSTSRTSSAMSSKTSILTPLKPTETPIPPPSRRPQTPFLTQDRKILRPLKPPGPEAQSRTTKKVSVEAVIRAQTTLLPPVSSAKSSPRSLCRPLGQFKPTPSSSPQQLPRTPTAGGSKLKPTTPLSQTTLIPPTQGLSNKIFKSQPTPIKSEPLDSQRTLHSFSGKKSGTNLTAQKFPKSQVRPAVETDIDGDDGGIVAADSLNTSRSNNPSAAPKLQIKNTRTTSSCSEESESDSTHSSSDNSSSDSEDSLSSSDEGDLNRDEDEFSQSEDPSLIDHQLSSSQILASSRKAPSLMRLCAELNSNSAKKLQKSNYGTMPMGSTSTTTSDASNKAGLLAEPVGGTENNNRAIKSDATLKNSQESARKSTASAVERSSSRKTMNQLSESKELNLACEELSQDIDGFVIEPIASQTVSCVSSSPSQRQNETKMSKKKKKKHKMTNLAKIAEELSATVNPRTNGE